MRDFAFYNAGCAEPQGLRKAIVPFRRLLRRLLRPILYRQAELMAELRDEVADLRLKLASQIAQNRQALEDQAIRQDLLDRQVETAIAMGWDLQAMLQRIGALEVQVKAQTQASPSSGSSSSGTSSIPLATWVAHSGHERGLRPHKPLWMAGLPKMRRMRVLALISSSNQIYSGIGRNIRELGKRLGAHVEFEFATDDAYPKNRDLLVKFAQEMGSKVHVGRGYTDLHYIDSVNDSLPELLAEQRWDAIELIGWANASTNRMGLEGAGNALIFYTPHYQPTWTVPMTPERARSCESVHQKMMHEADAVFCVSGWERATLQASSPHRNHCKFPTQGCDFTTFEPGLPSRSPQLLFVGDLRETRKRFDRVIATFARLLEHRPQLKLVVVGNGSDLLSETIPAHVRLACELRGYVTEAELKEAYAQSRGLFLLSDYEAFGLPVIEAMACGTPVFLTWQEATWSLFGKFKGANFCPADDLEATSAIINANLDRGDAAIVEVLAEREALRGAFDWGPLAQHKWQTMAACWYQKARAASSV